MPEQPYQGYPNQQGYSGQQGFKIAVASSLVALS
jgi:hypothetical protein